MNKLYIRKGQANFHLTPGSVGIDISVRRDIDLTKETLIDLQIWLRWERMDARNFVQIVARSSTFHNWGIMLTNGVGIVDASYCGERDVLKASVIKIDQMRSNIIRAGERFVQLVPVTFEPYEIIEDHSIPSTESRGGFGSTGI